jgi:hypothetical protein
MIDIMIRLRESDGGYFMRQMFTEAADEIESLRTERNRQTEIIVTLRQELKEAKARNTMYLSKIQEYEAREQ